MHAARWKLGSLGPVIALACMAPLAASFAGAAERLYGGRTVSEWRERIGKLDFTDPLITEE